MDDATGIGYMLYSAESVQTRFVLASPGHVDSADHLACVHFDAVAQLWMVHHSDGPAGPANDWATSFEPRETDLLIADIDFDEAEIMSAVVSAPTTVHGVQRGIASTDLVFQPNTWDGAENQGEFGVSGTYVLKHSAASAVAYSSARSFAGSPESACWRHSPS